MLGSWVRGETDPVVEADPPFWLFSQYGRCRLRDYVTLRRELLGLGILGVIFLLLLNYLEGLGLRSAIASLDKGLLLVDVL